jgi:hypothetical protein
VLEAAAQLLIIVFIIVNVVIFHVQVLLWRCTTLQQSRQLGAVYPQKCIHWQLVPPPPPLAQETRSEQSCRGSTTQGRIDPLQTIGVRCAASTVERRWLNATSLPDTLRLSTGYEECSPSTPSTLFGSTCTTLATHR